MNPGLERFVESWAPEPVTAEDPMPPAPAAAMAAALDRPAPVARAGDPLPPLWHWLYFLHWPRRSELGEDGHLENGRLLPPIPDRHRMFAGGRLTVEAPLVVGEPAQCTSGLAAVTPKQGRSGDLLFVTERRELRQGGRLCAVEEQEIVYRSGRVPTPGVRPCGPEEAPAADGPWSLTLPTDPVLLFQVSALTANPHRIHYDLPYTVDEANHPGLLVHGPLLALLMLDLVRDNAPERRVRSYSYRLHRPVYAGERVMACGDPTPEGVDLHIRTAREDRHAGARAVLD
ncbi:MaoC family dehydratase N-terminal domain-containing protein [Nocardiopsis halophila]|uniref:MaoC family dehydratase N-terminal domain-containing protein n=1 Tax=Nocardiopsis halophila TaxID=141692 RepID=UPI000344A8EE|nr:MaoC family dehydratase N-terminal domain-containing protein [Nocardiopsis halophila]